MVELKVRFWMGAIVLTLRGYEYLSLIMTIYYKENLKDIVNI
jgi:hypothetical protein